MASGRVRIACRRTGRGRSRRQGLGSARGLHRPRPAKAHNEERIYAEDVQIKETIRLEAGGVKSSAESSEAESTARRGTFRVVWRHNSGNYRYDFNVLQDALAWITVEHSLLTSCGTSKGNAHPLLLAQGQDANGRLPPGTQNPHGERSRS